MSKADNLRLIEMARRRGYADLDILKEVLQNVYGAMLEENWLSNGAKNWD